MPMELFGIMQPAMRPGLGRTRLAWELDDRLADSVGVPPPTLDDDLGLAQRVEDLRRRATRRAGGY